MVSADTDGEERGCVITSLSLSEEVGEKAVRKQCWCLARRLETPSVASCVVKLLSAPCASPVSVKWNLTRSGEPSGF